ncbi:SDR family NAD(P)-dependent oxidoreductase [Aliikangiella maris]|uniref:SDR family NAD(P)-dependent oxidoreductase n=2 Tax=Aliikangiella maris TaxID=3162458 RepID=A0ABV3ML08_9GAMM
MASQQQASLKSFILKQLASNTISQSEAKQYLAELTTQASQQNQEIAVIGMSGQFPMSDNVDEFWNLVRSGVNCIRDFPLERKRDFTDFVCNPHFMELLKGKAVEPDEYDELYAKAGYLNNIDKFDNEFFGLPPTEATYMDPQQRIALETAWATIEDAGYGAGQLNGTSTGVYIGKETTNFSLYRYYAEPDPMQLTGSWESIIASRISYLFNFRGPCMMVDTACSAGLVSIHMAATALKDGECDLAIAGGINVVMSGEFSSSQQVIMNMDSVESHDGIVRTFDNAANGTVWGEGIGFVMLKPLSKALRDSDNIHAVIKGSAINNDGASNGLTAPNADAQEEVIVRAWKNADINPETLSYIEAHGTGTVLGDPIEIKGLTSAFRQFTDRKQFCAIGTLKPNMGHLVSASGSAGLFKIILAMKHKELPPMINFNAPNPYINFIYSPLYVSNDRQPWETGGIPRRAGINSFGFSHTNCHMVVEEAPVRETLASAQAQYCLPVSAKKLSLLGDYIERYISYCNEKSWELADLCYTAATGRSHYEYRVAIVASTQAEIIDGLMTAKQLIESGESQLVGNVAFGFHQIVSDKKKQLDAGEITEKNKKELTDKANQSLTSFLNSQDKQLLTSIAENYANSAEVNWRDIYQQEKRQRISVPTYPFERKRFWAKDKKSSYVDVIQKLHPLIDRCTEQAENKWTYEAVFRSEKLWVLTDHKIMHDSVIPGTTYIEMTRACVALALGWKNQELFDLYFLQPMIVKDKHPKKVRISLTKQKESGDLNVLIESTEQNEKSANWQTHFEGKIKALSEAQPDAQPIDPIKHKAVDGEQVYDGSNDTGVFQFGPHWDTIRSTWRFDNDTLGSMVLPSEFTGELNEFKVHPSMLDNAMNLTSQDSGETYLPFLYKSFKIFGDFQPKMYTLLTHLNPSKDPSVNNETNQYDVVLLSESGEVIAVAAGYYTKKVHSFDFEANTQVDSLASRWVPFNQAEGQSENVSLKKLTVIVDEHTDTSVLTQWQVADIDIQVVQLCAGETDASYQSGQLPNSTAGFISLFKNDDFKGSQGILFYVDHKQTAVQLAFHNAIFHLTKAIAEEKPFLSAGINLIGNQAFSVNDNQAKENAEFNSLALLTTTMGMENTAIPVRVCDLEQPLSQLDHSQLTQLLHLATGKILASRNSTWLIRELYHQPVKEIEGHAFKENGTYLITGGLGGLGLKLAEYITQQVKANILLVGRSPFAAESEWQALATASDANVSMKQINIARQLVELSRKSLSVRYLQLDIANSQQVVDIAQTIQQELGAIDGIFHAAGVAGDGYLLRKNYADFATVLQPKITGTENLLTHFVKPETQFAILFSSIMAVTGGEGQGDYAAANAYMDSIATNDERFIAINWPSWNDVGMAVDFAVDDSMTPFKSIASKDAFAQMEKIIKAKASGIIPTDINPEFLNSVIDDLPFALSTELAGRVRLAKQEEGGAEIDFDTFEVDIRGKSVDELSPIELDLAKVYAMVLGLQEIDVFKSFQDMGGNSMIAAQLLKVLEQRFKGHVDISDIFSYPSIDEMAQYLNEKLGFSEEATENTEVAETKSDQDWENILDKAVSDDGDIEDILKNL